MAQDAAINKCVFELKIWKFFKYLLASARMRTFITDSVFLHQHSIRGCESKIDCRKRHPVYLLENSSSILNRVISPTLLGDFLLLKTQVLSRQDVHYPLKRLFSDYHSGLMFGEFMIFQNELVCWHIRMQNRKDSDRNLDLSVISNELEFFRKQSLLLVANKNLIVKTFKLVSASSN
jgi:hypothetical protein